MALYALPLVHVPRRWSLSISETGAEPVTVAEIKDHTNYSDTDKDALFATFATAARRMVEKWTGRAIIEQTRTLKMDGFPPSDKQVFELPGGNIQSVTSIQYIDIDGATQSFTDFHADLGTEGGTARIGTNYDASWPGTRNEHLPVTVVYVAGYDISASPPITPPAELLVAIRYIAADMFARREATSVERYEDNPMLSALVSPYKLRAFT